MNLRGLRDPLLRWYRANGRDLPWRRTRDPYAIWVSEVMLQQTRVAVVIPYYERFLQRFPDIETLARSGEEEVLAAWSGLGYYRRARALLAGARQVAERHGGYVPDEPEALRALPGVGRYTSGAIASVAFGREEPVLDGNVKRVFSRLFALGPMSAAREEREHWSIAGALVRGEAPGDLNQALMELGATVCTPRAPACDRCPVHKRCAAHASGEPEWFPSRTARPTPVDVRVAVAIVERAGKLLLERPGAASPLRGTWDLPAFELPGHAEPLSWIEREIERRHGLSVRAIRDRGRLRHSILHRRLRIEVYSCRLARGVVRGRSDLQSVSAEAANEMAISGATRKALSVHASPPSTAPPRTRGRARPSRTATP